MQAVIGTFDSFFYYGENDIALECINDVSETILQPKGSMFYDRANGTDLAANRNNPRGGMLDFLMRFDIAASIARRNKKYQMALATQKIGASQRHNRQSRLRIHPRVVPMSQCLSSCSLDLKT